MKSLKFALDERRFDLNEFTLLTLVVEDKMLLNNYLCYLFNDFIGKEKYWRVEIDSDPKDLDECADFVPSFYQLDINTKRNINALYKLLKKVYYEKLENNMTALKEQASKIIKEIAMDFDVELIVNSEIKEDDLFKIMDLKFSDEETSLKERLIKYMFVTNELRGIEIFFVFNLHQHFGKDDINIINKEVSYHKIKMVNLEFNEIFEKTIDEITLVVDSDLCSI